MFIPPKKDKTNDSAPFIRTLIQQILKNKI